MIHYHMEMKPEGEPVMEFKIAGSLADITTELVLLINILTVALSQLNRASAQDGKIRRPQLTDLRESGQIEQDADTIIFIWREQKSDTNAPRNIFVAKNKEGTIGEFTLLMDGAHQQFRDAPPPMPAPRRPNKSTPVIGREAEFEEVTGEDEKMPF